MKTKEYLHMADEYRASGLVPFLEHVKGYLKGDRTVPVSMSNGSDNFPPVFFTFGHKLLEEFVREPKKLEKPYEAAIKYGFRGYSCGGRNGIFLQRKSDGGLLTATDTLTRRCAEDVTQDLDCSDISALIKIKIVCHAPHGNRVVGIYNSTNKRAIFLGIATY